MKLRRYMTGLLSVAVVAMAIAVAPSTGHAAKGVLKLHEGDWTGNLVTCRLLKIILEEELDYKVKEIAMPAGPAVAEAIRGGDIDFACESWPSYSPTKDKYISEYGGDGSVELIGHVGVIGQSGYYVPRYVIEGDEARGIKAMAPDLKTYKDLNKYKDLFKTFETGDKGRLVACPVAAWSCMDKERAEGLGLEYELVELGSEAAHWAEIAAAYKRGEPIIAYAWEPHWIHAKYDLVEIGLPDYSEAAWPVSDWSEDVTYNYGSPSLKDKYPDAHHVIGNMNLTNVEQAGMILAIDIDKVPMEDAVRAWMAKNEKIWRAWMPSGS